MEKYIKKETNIKSTQGGSVKLRSDFFHWEEIVLGKLNGEKSCIWGREKERRKRTRMKKRNNRRRTTLERRGREVGRGRGKRGRGGI